MERACGSPKDNAVVARERQLYGNLSKYVNWVESVEFLGDVVSGQGIYMNPKKVEAV